MNKVYRKIAARPANVRFFSPGGFLACALLIMATFAGLEALGLRSSITVLIGESPSAGGWPALSTAYLYLLCYLAFVGLVPILLLGSIFLLLLNLIISIFHQKGEHLAERV
jgi:hypothetical protein